MGVFSNSMNKPAQPVTAWFCKVRHHLVTTKQKISKPLRGGNPDSTENNRGRQGRSIYTPVKYLLGTGTQTPEKRHHRRPFLSPLMGLLHFWSVCKAAQAALAGGLGVALNKQIFHVFAKAKNGKIAKCVPLCPACHYCKR